MPAPLQNIDFIDLKQQYRRLKPAIDERIHAVLNHGQYIMGPEVAELEKRLAEYVGVRHAVGISDGTTALQVAMNNSGSSCSFSYSCLFRSGNIHYDSTFKHLCQIFVQFVSFHDLIVLSFL